MREARVHSKAGENGAAVSVLRLHTLLTPCPVLPERVFDDCLPYAAGKVARFRWDVATRSFREKFFRSMA